MSTQSMRRGAEPVLVALATGGITALAVGVPTDVIDTPLFTRQLPVSWWEAPVVVTMAVLAAIAGGAVALRRRRAGTGEHTTVAGVLSVVGATLAVGCPVCNAVAVGVLGTAGAMSIWAPVQPVLAAASILAMGVFAVRRVRAARCGDEGCRTPVSSGGAR
ncbi:hypothetical protein TPB0596_03500 [Tsukamurella pulmonis]|uniref:Uncharacterized protein n=1 Tax=Tsukamurella pulmonis TaxID=47312 RepID=A0A1H1HP93_9ACTN|nr:hypothetical protein [Tsukamurella pulmonis]BDD80587.1 hypothetical protein TPB0596_03500 [Tsukamurella pulmonis]SDR27237.1 hypothetical protein SAMN04489765_4432 [Tsukamurella pulmonis]SUP13752.1 Uncharacterised protein [Tsukamurella pulmonis]